jgi:hypothetical protein
LHRRTRRTADGGRRTADGGRRTAGRGGGPMLNVSFHIRSTAETAAATTDTLDSLAASALVEKVVGGNRLGPTLGPVGPGDIEVVTPSGALWSVQCHTLSKASTEVSDIAPPLPRAAPCPAPPRAAPRRAAHLQSNRVYGRGAHIDPLPQSTEREPRPSLFLASLFSFRACARRLISPKPITRASPTARHRWWIYPRSRHLSSRGRGWLEGSCWKVRRSQRRRARAGGGSARCACADR